MKLTKEQEEILVNLMDIIEAKTKEITEIREEIEKEKKEIESLQKEIKEMEVLFFHLFYFFL